VDRDDLLLRNVTYALFVQLGRAPTTLEVAERAGLERTDVVAGWQRLHDQHALVLQDRIDTTHAAIRMANPFSGVPTRYRVEAAGKDWFANCAWDALGIPAALHADGRIRSTCPDCGLPIDIHVVDGRPDVTDLGFHCLVPAAQWWDDIVFT
jgi:hypothetical protein